MLHYHRLGKLNYCVRYGNRCFLSDIVTGKYPSGPVKARPGKFVVGPDGCVPYVLAFQPLIRELLVTTPLRSKSLRPKILAMSVATRESVEYMWPSVRPLVPVSYAHYWACTSGLSTLSSSRGLSHPKVQRNLILERASRLDAFSVYPFRT